MAERVGYRFHPTDEELVSYFLKHKIDGHDILVDNDIHVIDLCKIEPWDLPGFASQGSNDQVWYFFYRREPKYKNTSRRCYNRSTKTGHWKPTGAERYVKSKHTRKVIGIKKTLVFYLRASPKEIKTNWVIHEYEPKNNPHQVDLVLCKLKEKSDDKAATSGCDEGESSGNGVSDLESTTIEIPASEVDQELLFELLAGQGMNFNHPSVQQPEFHIDEGFSIDDIMLTDDVFDSGTASMALQFDVNGFEEDPNEMADSFIVYPDEYGGEEHIFELSRVNNGYSHEESAQARRNHSGSPQSVSGIYLDDLDNVNTEVVYGNGKSAQFGASNLTNHRTYRQTQRVQAFTETLPPSAYEQSGMSKKHVHQDEIRVMEASSAESSTNCTEKIKYTGVASKECPVEVKGGLRISEKAMASGKSQIQGNSAAPSKQKVQLRFDRKPSDAVDLLRNSKGRSMVKTEKHQKMGKEKVNLESRTKGKPGFLIRQEASLPSRRQYPQAVYAFNAVIGLGLFIAACREVFIVH